MKIDMKEHVGAIIGTAVTATIALAVGYGMMQATLSDTEAELEVLKVKHETLRQDFSELVAERAAGVAVVRRVGKDFDQVRTLVLHDLDPRVRTVEMLIRVAEDGQHRPYVAQLQHAVRQYAKGDASTASRPYSY